MAHSDEILNCDKNRNELFLSGRGLQWFYLICNSVTVSSICLIVMQVLRQLQRRGIYFRVDKSLVYEGERKKWLRAEMPNFYTVVSFVCMFLQHAWKNAYMSFFLQWYLQVTFIHSMHTGIQTYRAWLWSILLSLLIIGSDSSAPQISQ